MHNVEYWTSCMVKIMLAKTIIITGKDRLLANFTYRWGKKTATCKFMVGTKKKQCFRTDDRKKYFFLLILEMEGRQIRNP
jgi:hypothetical protein